jgi:hypothetical protein
MTGEERERMYELCGQIIIEEDPAELIRLTKELNDLWQRLKWRRDDYS